MEITEARFRALARSSPWRWSSAHLTWHDAIGSDSDAVAWIRDRTCLRVEHRGEVQVEHHQGVAVARCSRDGRSEAVTLPRALDVTPVTDGDGLVLVRPDRVAADLDDPFWQTYRWIAMLDPAELADGDGSRDPTTGEEVALPEGEPVPSLDPEPYPGLGWPTGVQVPGTVVTDLRAAERRGRETWWARATPTWAYEPRCSCCPLLWGEVSEWLESQGGGPVSECRDYPQAYEVALDVQTGICVQVTPLGPAPPFAGHDLTIHEVDADYPDELFTDGSVAVAQRELAQLIDRVRDRVRPVDG